MLHDIKEPSTHEHTTCGDENCGFRKFANWFKPRATEMVQKALEQAKDNRLLFVRAKTDVSLYDVWVKTFATDELKQEHTCHACKRYLNGMATFGLINENVTAVNPFALPAVDEAFNTDVPSDYHAPYKAVLNTFASAGWDIPLVSDIADYGDIYGTEEAGGWAHMSVDYSSVKRATIRHLFEKHFADPKGTGLGRVEIKASQEWLSTLLSVADQKIPMDKIRIRDRDILKRLQAFVNTHVEGKVDRSLLIRADMILHDIGFLRTRNTVVGVLLENLAKGMSLEAALKAYNQYTDPRNYMRPTSMPSEAKFEQDVAFLTEKGYDKFMPMRLATLDDMREHGMLNWEKSREENVEDKAPIDIFAKARLKVKASAGKVEKQTPSYSKVAAEDVSMYFLVNEIFGNPENIDEILFEPKTYHWGSFAISHVTEGNNIFEDGKLVRHFISTRQIYNHEARHYYTSDEQLVPIAYHISKDRDSGDNIINLVYEGCKWKVPLPTPLFAVGLIPELRERRQTIEHFMATNALNAGPDDKPLEYENTLLSIPVMVGHAIVVRTKDGFERTYIVTSRK